MHIYYIDIYIYIDIYRYRYRYIHIYLYTYIPDQSAYIPEKDRSHHTRKPGNLRGKLVMRFSLFFPDVGCHDLHRRECV